MVNTTNMKSEIIAKTAIENAINDIKRNAKKLEEFVGQDISITTREDFNKFATIIGDVNIAKSYCLIKYGKTILEVIQ